MLPRLGFKCFGRVAEDDAVDTTIRQQRLKFPPRHAGDLGGSAERHFAISIQLQCGFHFELWACHKEHLNRFGNCFGSTWKDARHDLSLSLPYYPASLANFLTNESGSFFVLRKT